MGNDTKIKGHLVKFIIPLGITCLTFPCILIIGIFFGFEVVGKLNKRFYCPFLFLLNNVLSMVCVSNEGN